MSRKGILDNQVIRQCLKEIIIDYDENYNSNVKITYVDIYEHVKYLFLQKKIDFEYPSYTWWKTTGKELVDEFNRIKTKTIRLTEKDEIDIPDITDILNKFGGLNKEKLREQFKPLENQVNRLIDKIDSQNQLINRLEEKLKHLDDEIKKEKTLNSNLQSIILSFFLYSKKTKSMFLNMMETGEHHNEIVNLSLTRTFGSPKDFIDALIDNVDVEQLNGLINKNDRQKVNKVLQYANNHIENDEKEEYDW